MVLALPCRADPGTVILLPVISGHACLATGAFVGPAVEPESALPRPVRQKPQGMLVFEVELIK